MDIEYCLKAWTLYRYASLYLKDPKERKKAKQKYKKLKGAKNV